VPAPLIEAAEPLQALTRELADHEAIAFDLEGDGLYRYRSQLCAVQLATRDGDIRLIDTLAITDRSPLNAVLGPKGPRKTVHDVSFERIAGFRTRIPMVLRIGGTLRLGRLALNGELEKAFSSGFGYSRKPRLALGLELRPFGFLPLRAGLSAWVEIDTGHRRELLGLRWPAATGDPVVAGHSGG